MSVAFGLHLIHILHGKASKSSSTSFKHYLPSLCSPVLAVADPSENVDEAWMPVCICSCITGCYSRAWLTRENSWPRMRCMWGAYPRVANLSCPVYS